MDRSLAALLQSLQVADRPEQAARLLPSAIHLLFKLSNPLNVTLLTSQLLAHGQLFANPAELPRCGQVFSVFYSATLRLIEDAQRPLATQQPRSDLSLTEWLRAAVRGADETSPRWRHTILIGGILLALQSRRFDDVTSDLRHKLEGALVTASNLALHERATEPNSELALVFVLNHTFPILSEHHRAQLNYDLLLPVLVDVAFFSRDGLEQGYWLGPVGNDLRPSGPHKFSWPANAASFRAVSEVKSRSLVAGLGALSRLIAHAVDNARQSTLIPQIAHRVSEFTGTLATAWRQNKLSEMDPGDEAQWLDQETAHKTLPVLLQLLRDAMFATVIILRAILGRMLCDAVLAAPATAPGLAIQALHTLRDTYFIAHRFGLASSSQYNFVRLAAIDVLTRYPLQSEAFLESIRSSHLGRVPPHQLDRLRDLFFLNTAEHFTLTVSPRTSQDLLFNAATPYIDPRGDARLGELYEAAHSVMLAILAAPQNAGVVAEMVPFYVETLLHSFPRPLMARQFRLAIKSVVRLAAPPSPMAVSMPWLQPVVLDLLRDRLERASEGLLPPSPDLPVEENVPLSEKAVLFLSVVDCLCFLPVPLLEEWLPMTAELLHKVHTPAQRQQCQQRLWEALSHGEMDVERAAACVAWWTSRGGREHVLQGEQPEEQQYTMSGALLYESKL